MKMNNISKEIEVLVAALKNDKDYYYSWQANIAMSIVDQFAEKGLSGHFVVDSANIAAKNFLEMFIGTNKQ